MKKNQGKGLLTIRETVRYNLSSGQNHDEVEERGVAYFADRYGSIRSRLQYRFLGEPRFFYVRHDEGGEITATHKVALTGVGWIIYLLQRYLFPLLGITKVFRYRR